jgi:hypothetical protein
MREARVVAIEVRSRDHADDPHPAALQLEDGRQVSAARAITNLRYGVERYVVLEGEGRYVVRVVAACRRCGLAYLRADNGGSTADRLLHLPSSPFGTPFPGTDAW